MNILLACTGGMSASILVDRMKKEAEGRGIDCNIEYINKSEIEKRLSKNDFNVMLLSPQLSLEAGEYKAKAEEGAIVELIDMVKFGACDGHATFNYALELLGM